MQEKIGNFVYKDSFSKMKLADYMVKKIKEQENDNTTKAMKKND